MNPTLLAVCSTLSFLLAACAGAARDPGAPPATPDAGSANPVTSQGVGLHPDGAVAIKRASASRPCSRSAPRSTRRSSSPPPLAPR